MKYTLTQNDFKTAFEFAVKYHLEPKKPGIARTSGASRGLGEIIDSFLRGKLVEIGVVKILQNLNPKKQYFLDFEIRPTVEAKNDPDIVSITENNQKRSPNLFIEIKNASPTDRWVGPTVEQFDTMKNSAGDLGKIFIIGACIDNNDTGRTNKQKDLFGMYLRKLASSDIFDSFADAGKTFVSIEYALSGSDLQKYGIVFRKDDLFYETEVITEATEHAQKQLSKSKFKELKSPKGYLELYSPNHSFPSPQQFGKFILHGNIRIFEKKNEQSTKRFILAETNAEISNKTLGKFELKKGRLYLFNPTIMGRNPVLARNNLWLAKRAISFLQEQGQIKSAEETLQEVAERI